MVAPEGVNVMLSPAQIVPLLIDTTGNASTVTFATALVVEVHPAVLVPLTVYDEVTVGDTKAEPPVIV